VILFLRFPTGANSVSSGGYDPGMQVPWSRALSTNWTAAGMFSVYWPTQGRARNVTGESTFLLDRQLTKPWDAFVEYAGDFPENGGPRHLLHFGTALKITKQQQIDFHVGGHRPRWIISSGSAIRSAFRRSVARRALGKLVSLQTHRRGTRMRHAGREGPSTFGDPVIVLTTLGSCCS
jgi:Putative MetA-pathway of phenol degradation